MNEKRLPPRLMVLLVVLKGEKVYKVPIRSEIELDHLKDFNTLRRILTPLVQLYHGVGFDTRLTYLLIMSLVSSLMTYNIWGMNCLMNITWVYKN